MTKHQAMFEWMGAYPHIKDLYSFDFGKVSPKSTLFRLISDETVKTDIRGTETVNYKFGIAEYKHIEDDPFTNENIENVEAVDAFIAWVKEQDKLKNYPQIEGAKIERIRAVRTGAGIASVDQIMRVAQYTFTVIVTYTREA